MKFIQKTILILSLVLIPTFFINAQSEVIDLGDGFTATIEETTEDLFEAEDIFIESGLEEDVEQLIYISDIRAEFENYEPGDMVQGQFVINNTTESPVLNVYYDIELETEGPIVLDPRSSKDIFFSYKLPVDESISDININLVLEDGTTISSGVLDFNASEELNDQSTGYAKYGFFLIIFLGLILLIIKFKRKYAIMLPMIIILFGLGVEGNFNIVEGQVIDSTRYETVGSRRYKVETMVGYGTQHDEGTKWSWKIKQPDVACPSGWTKEPRGTLNSDIPSNLCPSWSIEWYGKRHNPWYEHGGSTAACTVSRNLAQRENYRGYSNTQCGAGDDECAFAMCSRTTLVSTDVCRNIGGTQTSVPSGYTRDASGNCNQTVTDVCRNIGGTQTSVPYGYTRDASGNCSQVDVCSNISGTQTSVPTGYVLNGNQCVLDSNCDDSHTENELFCDNGIEKKWNCSPIDLCPNIRGNQLAIPANYTKNSTTGNCDYSPVDLCTNIGGVQTSVPSGYTRSSSGICSVSSTGGGGGGSSTDVCPNIDGVQTTVPPYYFKNGSECTPYGQIEVQSIDHRGWNESCIVKISCSYDSPKNPHTGKIIKIDSGTEIDMNECKGKAVSAVNRGDTCGAPVSYVNWYDNSSLPKSWWFH